MANLRQLSQIYIGKIINPYELGHLRFIIMDCPDSENLNYYREELILRGVTNVVRLCQPTYDKAILEEKGINVLDIPYPDGGVPPPDVLQRFLELCEREFGNLRLDQSTVERKDVTIIDNVGVIAVHCVAGLGRAPVMVAVALIEAGMEPLDAITFIRQSRRGAFNATQLKYLLDTYKKRKSNKYFQDNKFFKKVMAGFVKKDRGGTVVV